MTLRHLLISIIHAGVSVVFRATFPMIFILTLLLRRLLGFKGRLDFRHGLTFIWALSLYLFDVRIWIAVIDYVLLARLIRTTVFLRVDWYLLHWQFYRRQIPLSFNNCRANLINNVLSLIVSRFWLSRFKFKQDFDGTSFIKASIALVFVLWIILLMLKVFSLFLHLRWVDFVAVFSIMASTSVFF